MALLQQHRRNLKAGRKSRRFAVPSTVRSGAADEQGATLVEFALVLPLMLLVLFGIAQFALAFNAENDETHLANEVARYAAVNEDPSSKSLQEWGKSQADTKALSGQVVCISFPVNEATKTKAHPGDPVEVEVKGTINWLPILKLKALSQQVLGRADMRLEAPPSAYAEGCK